jgi:FRG domain
MDRARYRDFKDFLGVVEAYDEGELCLFRGQPCDKPLLPKIARKDPKHDTTRTEKEMLAELRRRGTLFIGKEIADDWDLLVYPQHFGMATRLLDWTSNPLAALWFASSEGAATSSGYVYLLEVSGDLLLERKTQKDPFKVGKTRVFKPNLNSTRIVAQSGWFTAHRYSTSYGRFVPLESNTDIKERLVQIEILGGEKQPVLKKLDTLGVNSQSLFPDVEGVCKYINWVHGVQ